MGMSWVVIKDSVCRRKASSDWESKDLDLGLHVAVA